MATSGLEALKHDRPATTWIWGGDLYQALQGRNRMNLQLEISLLQTAPSYPLNRPLR